MYGKELILDIHDCDVEKFTKESIIRYFVDLCNLIDMKRYTCHIWDDYDMNLADMPTKPKSIGISAVQFIYTSSIILHALRELGDLYINIFSCEDFDTIKATQFTISYFVGNLKSQQIIERL